MPQTRLCSTEKGGPVLPHIGGVSAGESTFSVQDTSPAVAKGAMETDLYDQAPSSGSSVANGAPDYEKLVPVLAGLAGDVEILRIELQQKFNMAAAVGNQAEALKVISQKARALEEDQLFERVLKPLFLEFLIIYDDIQKAKACIGEAASADNVCQILKGVEIQILQMLARHGITAMTGTPEQFDPNCQKVIGVQVARPVKTGTIVQKCHTGFLINGQVFRYEGVIIIKEVNQ